MEKIFSNKAFLYSLFAIGGLLSGWLLFHSPETKENKTIQQTQASIATIWTCAMHPQLRMSEPGKCPICGMELIPLNQNESSSDPGTIRFSKEAAALANVETVVVSRQRPVMEVRLYGKIQADERLLQSQVAHISGRIDKLLVNYTGEAVSKGQVLAEIYSPELITAQQELLEAAKTKQTQAGIYEAARERLSQWKLTENQISGIENSGGVQNDFEITSNTNGIVSSMRVRPGDYISQGTILYEIADLSRVWVLFDAYESDLPFLKKGDKLTFIVQALPGKSFGGSIAFIDPVIDPVTRVARVRAEINNPAGALKPEMFATGVVKSSLDEYANNFVIPRSAVLWTGKRSIVYVKISNSEDPVFKMREIEIGPMLGDSYVVLGGLKEGEEIVSRGSFNVDAAAQLEGRPSMMNRDPVHNNEMQEPTPVKSKSIKKVTINVSGNCEMCKDRIETAAKSVKGVSIADWNIGTKILSLEIGSETDINDVHKAIAKAGHDTELMKADDETYKNLPACCLYRK